MNHPLAKRYKLFPGITSSGNENILITDDTE